MILKSICHINESNVVVLSPNHMFLTCVELYFRILLIAEYSVSFLLSMTALCNNYLFVVSFIVTKLFYLY